MSLHARKMEAAPPAYGKQNRRTLACGFGLRRPSQRFVPPVFFTVWLSIQRPAQDPRAASETERLHIESWLVFLGRVFFGELAECADGGRVGLPCHAVIRARAKCVRRA